MQIKEHDDKNWKKEISAEVGILQTHLFHCVTCEIQFLNFCYKKKALLIVTMA